MLQVCLKYKHAIDIHRWKTHRAVKKLGSLGVIINMKCVDSICFNSNRCSTVSDLFVVPCVAMIHGKSYIMFDQFDQFLFPSIMSKSCPFLPLIFQPMDPNRCEPVPRRSSSLCLCLVGIVAVLALRPWISRTGLERDRIGSQHCCHYTAFLANSKHMSCKR